jgi:hypothetical protein
VYRSSSKMANSAAVDDDNGSETPPPAKLPYQDDNSINTKQAKNNPVEILKEAKELFIKIEFVAKDMSNSNIPVLKLHRDLLYTLWNSYTPGVIMYDKNNNAVTKFTIDKMKNITEFQKLFDSLYRGKNKKKPARHVIVMKIKSAYSVYEIRTQEAMDKYTHDNNIYMREHPFPDYIIDTTSPGWLHGKHPTNHHHDDLKKEMIAEILAANPGAEIPFFHLSPCSPTRMEDNVRAFKTQALCINVDRKKNRALHKLLKETYKGKARYVQWNWKTDQPEVFKNAMVSQTTYLGSCWVIPIHGITEKQMEFLKPKLLASALVESVERTKTSEKTGRWNVIAKRLLFIKAKAAVQTILEQFENIVPATEAALPATWTKWCDEFNNREDSSAGDQSFLTTSAKSFASMVTDTDRENESINNGMEFDLSAMKNTLPSAPAPVAVNNDVEQELINLRTLLKNQTEMLKAMTDKIAAMEAEKTNKEANDDDNDDDDDDDENMADEKEPKKEERMSTLESQMSTVVAFMAKFMEKEEKESNKRNESISSDASSNEKPAKKADTKVTPTKSPAPGKAKGNQNP